MNKKNERFLAFAFGVTFVVVLLALATLFPNPTPFQYTVFRIVLALAAAGVASMISGFLEVEIPTKLKAGGAFAVFVIVFFFSPAGLVGVTVETEQDKELKKPVVSLDPPSRSSLISKAYAQSKPLPDLTVTKVDQLLRPEVWGAHYQSITIDGVHAQVPNHATLVANEIRAIHGGALTGSDFSVVARHVANTTIDVSGTQQSPAGSVHLYVKLLENSPVLASGAPGSPGNPGPTGANGADGAKGADAGCGGFGSYHGAHAGGNGGDAGNGGTGEAGHDGQRGGLVILTTITQPVYSPIDADGGKGGAGGLGGAPGTPGRAGAGGLGCTGLGGTAQNENPGQPGRPGQPGANGRDGVEGARGEYLLNIVPTFDPIIEKVRNNPSDKLYDALLTH